MKISRYFSTGAVPLTAALGFLGTPVHAQRPAAATTPPTQPPAPRVVEAMSLTAQTRRQVFETVWGRVNDRYYDPTFGGVNWKAVHQTYAPLMVKPQSDAAFYALLQKMLGELKRSHFAIIPPNLYTTEDSVAALAKPAKPIVTPGGGPQAAPATSAPTPPPVPEALVPTANADARDGIAGFEIRLVENEPTVWKVEKGSSAEQVGMKPGYIVTQLRNKPLAPIIALIRKSVKEPGEAAVAVRHGLAQALVGPVGSDLSVDVLDENNQPKTLTVKRDPLSGTPNRFGELPTLYVQTESRVLENNVGYIRFNIFLIPILEPVRNAIAQMRDKKVNGLIIDLRNNPGGIGALSNAIAGSVFSKRTDLGTMALRGGVARFPVFPQNNPYTGPLVILTDEGSASTSEIMAGSFQELGRATVVGQKTAGAVMPSSIETLPGTHARLQYAFADFKTPKGTLLEGRGVLPDIPVTVTRRALLDGQDPELAAALSYLQTKKVN